MNKRANLLKHVKGGSGWRYYPVAWLQNGSVRPNYVFVNGKAEHHEEGFYSIDGYENGKRRRQAVGREAREALPRGNRSPRPAAFHRVSHQQKRARSPDSPQQTGGRSAVPQGKQYFRAA